MVKKKQNNFDNNLEPMEQSYLESKKYKILVIDKDKESVEHNIARFKNTDYKFIECYKSKDILNVIKKGAFDMILLEVDLQELDGIELCYEIKNDVLLKKIPVVFLAERSDDYTQISAYDVGCDDFISKSSKSRLLVAKVKAMLNRVYEIQDAEKKY
jgi:two-component system alkaline phosphatase synthesis response regulator PhoP